MKVNRRENAVSAINLWRAVVNRRASGYHKRADYRIEACLDGLAAVGTSCDSKYSSPQRASVETRHSYK